MARRELLQLATPIDFNKHRIGGWLMSEKLDGMRCFWDGGVSRGESTSEIVYAAKLRETTATGLWSRYGNPIFAPPWFLDSLPPFPLDGELWAGRGQFQKTVSICRKQTFDPRWTDIQYAVYSSPPWAAMLTPGEIKNPNLELVIPKMEAPVAGAVGAFKDELKFLRKLKSKVCFLHQQTKLDAFEPSAREQVEYYMKQVVAKGGEGVVLRNPDAPWQPKRHAGILKYKPCSDDEGTLVGFIAGKGKLSGMIGALILDYHGKRLELSGMTNEERAWEDAEGVRLSIGRPGDEVKSQGRYFKTGDKITFKYREFTKDGIPREARYFRIRNES